MNLPTFHFLPIISIEKGESEQSNLSDKPVLDTIKIKIKLCLLETVQMSYLKYLRIS